MAKLFLVLTIIATLATAVVGYLGHQNVVKLQDTLKTTKSDLANTRSSLTKTQGELKTRTEELTAATATIEDQKTEIAKRKGESDKLTADLSTATAALDEKTKALAKAETDLAEALKGVGPGGTIKDLTDRVTTMTADLDKTKSELAEVKAVNETLASKNKEIEGKYTVAQSEVTRYQQGIAKVGLSGKILAVNPGWNFVVLSVGDKQGAAVGANMLVLRGNEPIAKAKITSVEPSTSIADVIPGTLRRGVTVQPGDTVIYEGPRK